MVMRMEARATQEMSLDQKQLQRHMEISKVAAVIEGRVVQELTRLCGNVQCAFRQVLSEENMSGIAARLGRATVFRLANEYVFPHPVEPLTDMDLIDRITDAVDKEFDTWWATRDIYTPVSNSKSEQQFTHERGVIDWGKAQTSRSIIASDEPEDLLRSTMQPLISSDGAQSHIGAVAECVTNLEHMFGIDPKMRAVFERVRTAVYGNVTPSNVDELLPKIRTSYEKAWLTPATIELLRHNKADKAAEFRRKTNKGVFVFGFDESVNGQPSVGEQMYKDFTAEKKETEPTYEGRYLMDDNGELLAWFTYWQPPRFPSDAHRSQILSYLNNGVTGGDMAYRRDPPKKKFKRSVDEILMIDTLRGGLPFAASRLVCKAASDIQRHYSNIKTLLGYRVYSLQMKPAFPGFREPIRMTENLSSSAFFADRDCANFAYDYNKKGGPMSERVLSDNSKMYLNPEWVAFNAPFDAFTAQSQSLWHEIQKKYGDVTHDA